MSVPTRPDPLGPTEGESLRLVPSFTAFLEDTVNINKTRLDLLDQNVAALKSFIAEHGILGPLFVKTIPQGSWAHQTIIRPVEGTTFDADLLVHLHHHPSRAPGDYIAMVADAFRANDLYGGMVEAKDRCVRINYADEHHVDLVPYVEINGAGYITNTTNNCYEDTDPHSFANWFRERDRISRGNLRRAVRLVKYIRDVNQRFQVKSVIITTLLGERVADNAADNDASDYGDVPTTLRTIVGDLATYLEGYPDFPPSVIDPTSDSRTFDHRWDTSTYPQFRASIMELANQIVAAYDESDRETSVALWQDIFGPDFKPPTDLKGVAKTLGISKKVRDHDEQFIEELVGKGIESGLGYRVKIACDVAPKQGFRSGELKNLGVIDKHRSLNFRITECSVALPYDVYWKVKNSGNEAFRAGAIRGEITKDAGTMSKSESTLYTGRHYVECYVVKKGIPVAKAHYLVPIR